MGMAASQARYLALVARKSNCEYEGQQINQARLNLSNQSANLFNQMLGLKVPVPPSTNDYTKTQYSFTDGTNAATIDSWYQLAEPDSEGYNYVVNYHYNSDVYTGSQKKMNDPQVQFSGAIPPSSSWETQIELITAAQKAVVDAEAELQKAQDALTTLEKQAARLSTYADTATFSSSTYGKYDSTTHSYNIYADEAGTNLKAIYVTYDDYIATYPARKEQMEAYIEDLKENGVTDIDTSLLYVADEDPSSETAAKTLAFKSDLEALKGTTGSVLPSGVSEKLTIYHMNGAKTSDYNTLESIDQDIAKAELAVQQAKQDVSDAKSKLEALSVPTYIGNTKLTSLQRPLTDAQIAEIKQVITDMTKQDVNTTLDDCFTNGNISDKNYLGGIYTFEMNGTTYYATYYDLAKTASEGTGINHIDNQPQLPYYNALYVSTRIDKQDKAILETDAQGRFTSIRLGDDTVKYMLNVETITDEAAYEDAMNQYYYENAKYDKMVQDINSKTSLIQQQDRTLELRLKQLDTEQNALSTEIDAVAKVVKDNVEKSFKTFGG